MMTKDKAIAVALVGVCGFGAWKLGSALLGGEAAGTDHVVNQLWIDHVPRDDRDMLTHLVVLDHPQGKFGAVGRSSQWRHMIEVFKWELSGDRLRLFFPQERARGEVRVKTWRCEGEAPAPFELCMELTNPEGQSMRLYSREDWKIQPRDAAGSLADLIEDEPILAGLDLSLDEADAERIDALDLDVAESWPVAWPATIPFR